jgi:hypothetical protein
MANRIYPKLKVRMATGITINFITTTIRVVMIDGALYTYDDAHEFLSDIVLAALVGISLPLAGKEMSELGAFSSNNARWEGITGNSVETAALFFDSGTPSSSRLIAFYDTGMTGLPVSPAGESFNGIPASGGWLVL